MGGTAMRQSYEVSNPRQAHEAVLELYQTQIKPHTCNGKRGRITWETINHHLRHELRKMFHGPILRDFSEQVWLPDPVTGKRVRYAPKVWKEHLKDLFCPPCFDKDGKEIERSTEALGDDQFIEFLTAVQAYGVVELGVEFTEKDDQ